MNRRYLLLVVFIGFTLMLYSAIGIGQRRAPTDPDGAQEAQTPRQVQLTRPEQQPTSHDQSDIFSPNDVPPSSTAFETQPDQRKRVGFDFARDRLNAASPTNRIPSVGLEQYQGEGEPPLMKK